MSLRCAMNSIQRLALLVALQAAVCSCADEAAGTYAGGGGSLTTGGSTAGGMLLTGGQPSSGGDGTTGGTPTEPTEMAAFRMSKLALVDPPLTVLVDVTQLANDALVTPALNGDTDPADGMLDLSFISAFEPLDPEQSQVNVNLLRADCSAPLSTTTCAVSERFPAFPSIAENLQEGVCLEPLAGTAAKAGALNKPVAPCFSAQADSLTLEFAGVVMQLDSVHVSATYAGDALHNGLLRGFLPKARADQTKVPEDRPVLGGVVLGNALRASDLDEGPDGESGYWVYLNFTAQKVPFTAQ